MCHFCRLWNGMFDRHRVEITVMQFTGHSLLVHQSVTVPWDFNPVPYCQPSLPTPKYYALPPSLEWHVWLSRRSIYNISCIQTTLCQSVILSVLSHEKIYLNICRNVRGVLTFVIYTHTHTHRIS